MEQKVFLFTAIPILGIILIFGYLNIQQNSSLAPETNSELCKSIEYNGNDRIDLLFISSEEEAKYYTDYLFTVEPYKTYRNYFNTNYIDQDVECGYYKDIAILCYNEQVLDIAKQCNHDYVIVVKEDSIKIRSSAYGNVISLNKKHEDSVLIHELGHALGNLAEEYGGARIPQGSKNCVSSCDKFTSETDSCDQECSESSYYRSIYAGVMRTLSTSNYGIYNNALLTQLFEKNKPKDLEITGNQILEEFDCSKKYQTVNIYQSEDGFDINTDNSLQNICAPDKGLAGQICIEEVCNINVLFTDYQDINEETLSGETYIIPEIPLTFYVESNPSNPVVEVAYNNQIIGTINTAEAGATACAI